MEKRLETGVTDVLEGSGQRAYLEKVPEVEVLNAEMTTVNRILECLNR